MRHMLRPHVGARPSALSAYAHWKLDELTTGNATDSVGPYTLTATDAPGVAGSLFAVPPGTTGARTFNGTTQILQNFVNSASLAAALANEGAVSLVFKADALSGTHALFTYEGLTASSAQDENKIISIYIYLDEIKVQWEYGSGTLVDSTTSGLGLDLTEFLLVVSWSGETTKTLNVYVFDRGGGLYFEQEFTGLTGANGGENADITLACGRDNTLYFDGTMDDVVLWKAPLTRDAAFMLHAETFGISYDEETIYSERIESHHVRVRVENGSGALVDLTNVAHGQDVVLSADVSDDIDSPGAQATVTLMREIDADESSLGGLEIARWSFSAFSEDSAYYDTIQLNRRILIDTAVVPEGDAVQEWDWVPLFDGFISAFDVGRDEMSIECTDKIGPLFDVFIGREALSISSIDDSGAGATLEITTSTPHGLAVGDTFKVYNTTNFDGSYTVATLPSSTQITSVESITGSPASESSGLLFPPDVATYGSALGTPMEDVIQDIIDDNAPPTVGYVGGTPTLYTPTSPSFDLQPYYQKREQVQTAIENLALMIGWTCRYKWDAEIRTFRLTIEEPNRTASSPYYTFDNDEIIDISRASVDSKDIRNVVELTFSDSTAPVDGAGQYPRVMIRKDNPTSVTKYGYRLCQIAEASTSQIDTFAEASDLADAILSDLAEPRAEITIEVPFRRFVDLGDLYRLPSNRYQWDRQKDVAVVGYTHSLSSEGATTTLTMRGQPAAATNGWKTRLVEPGRAPNQPLTPPIAPSLGPNLTPLAGGVEVASPWPLDDLRARNIDTTEIHLSQTSGFLPDASTLREIIRANRQDLHGLDPATTYYLRTRFRDRFGNASPWSSQSSVTPRYMLNVPAAHIHLSADQTIASSGVATVVQFNDEEYDTRGSYNSASYKFVAPVSGIYLVTCQLTVETLKSNERARVDLYLDGGSPTLLAQGANMEGDDQTYIAHPFINVAYHLDAGDEVDARVTVTNASSVVKNGEQSHITYVLVSQDDP